jgi:hypothetical protein
VLGDVAVGVEEDILQEGFLVPGTQFGGDGGVGIWFEGGSELERLELLDGVFEMGG